MTQLSLLIHPIFKETFFRQKLKSKLPLSDEKQICQVCKYLYKATTSAPKIVQRAEEGCDGGYHTSHTLTTTVSVHSHFPDSYILFW